MLLYDLLRRLNDHVTHKKSGKVSGLLKARTNTADKKAVGGIRSDLKDRVDIATVRPEKRASLDIRGMPRYLGLQPFSHVP